MKSKIIFTPLIIIIEYYLIISINSKISLVYPHSISLETGNILIIHKFGVSIYDSSLNNLIKEEIIFEEEEQIKNEESLSKITVESFKKYIFSLINDKIYIFNKDEGKILYKSEKIIEKIEDAEYYTLSPINITNDINYSYIIGYVDNNNLLNLLYYLYNSKNNQNELIISKKGFKHEDNYKIYNKGLSCRYLKSSYSQKEALCCFYSYDEWNLVSSFYSINKNSITNDQYFKPQRYNSRNVKNIKYIKSATNYNRDTALICIYQNYNDKTFCLKYFINQNIFYDLVWLINPCRNKYYSIDVKYYPEKKDIIFSCIGNNGNLQALIYDKNLNIPEFSIKNFISCENIFGFSILYNNESREYDVISDVNCNGTEYPIVELGGKLSNKNNEIIIEKEETNKIENITIEYESEKIEKNETICIEKCEICDIESLSKNLCIQCNTLKGYFPLYNPTFLLESEMFVKNEKYIDCVNNETKPSNYYFNAENNNYSPCFETCATCEYGGNGIENNCTTCEMDLIKRPELKHSKNCVVKCSYFYYYTSYGQYKCSSTPQCPKGKIFLIREIGKCTENCKNENIYKYQYNGECLEKCPKDTKEDEEFICKEINIQKCHLTQNKIDLNENNLENGIEKIVENYAKEFNYTENHVSFFNNSLFKVIIYKNSQCLSELNLKISEIDFGLCYKRIQIKKKINNNLIIVMISKINKNTDITKYEIYDPITGEKIFYDEICKNDTTIVQQNLYSKLNHNNTNIDTILFLTNQNVDIFNISGPFYTDICYYVETPFKKDITLKDRIKLYYPNITLCENGCIIKSINLTSLKANCICKINNLIGNDIFAGNALYQNQLEEINELITDSNIYIIKCYKFAFWYNYFIYNVCGYIIEFLILCQIIFTILYYKRSSHFTKKYIFILIEKYIQYLINLQKKKAYNSNLSNSFYLCEIDSNKNNNNNNLINNNCPPIKKTHISDNKNEKNEIIKKRSSNISNNISIDIINNNINNDIKENVNNDINNNLNIDISQNINRDNNKNINKEKNEIINPNLIKVYKRKRKRASKTFVHKRSSRQTISKPVNENNFVFKKKMGNINNISNYENILNSNNNTLIASGERLININIPNNKRASKLNLSKRTKSTIFDENTLMSKDILSKYKQYDEEIKDFKEEDLNIKIDIEEYLSTDYDDMGYDDAIKRDKRTFSNYLYDKLKSNQIILSTFYSNEPLRPKSIKILLLILDIDLYLLVNGLFYNDEYISELFHSDKEENFFSFIPRSYDRFLYTTIVGVVVDYVIDCFFIEEKKIKGIFKREKTNRLFLKYETTKKIKEINNRYTGFIILSFIIIVFTWYYISCFNYVFHYTRIEWMKSSVLIIIFMQIISILTCLLVSIIRFIGFKLKSEKIYKISLLL